ncbi:MAG: HAMP domain-containing histidine kinase [Lachnospiraceae bacterium]|nr:HAMP domain-containing histidine kinase [Lachnospiraceae bacterium]
MRILSFPQFTEKDTRLKNKIKNRSSKGIIALMMAALVAGLVIGCGLLFIVPNLSGRQRAKEKVTELGQRFSEAGISNYDTGAVRTLVVDRDGNKSDFFISVETADFNENFWPDSWYLKLARQYLDETLSGESVSHLRITTNELGELFVYTVSGAPLYTDGKITGAVYMYKRNSTIATTILVFMVLFIVIWTTALVLYISYKSRQKRQEEINTVKQNYVANVAHSLKTPITATKAMAEALSDGIIEDPEKQKQYCRQIYDESEKLERLVIDIMKLSEIQSASRDFSKEEVLMEECFEQIMDRYEGLCGTRGLKLVVADDFYNVPILMTNVSYLKEACMIIMDNALKFAKSRIDVSSSVKGKCVIVCIKDDGPGISSRDLPLIFERFYKGKDIDNPGGNGLGLAIARESLNGMGEKIWAESDGKSGSEFFFTVHTT